MAIDFPNSPTNGDLYTVGGKTWQWNGTFWAGYGTSPDLTISDTPPASPNIGDQWFESDTGRWLVYYDNAWVELTSSAVVSPNANDLSGTTLASNVVNSSLASVGTLGSLTVTGDLTVDTSTLKVDSTNNRVGVANASPAYTLDVNGTVEATQFLQGSDYLTPYNGLRNAIINGDFRINQRAWSSSTASGTYGFDRWKQVNSGGTVTMSSQSFTVGSPAATGYEAATFARVLTASQSGTGDYALLVQQIENVRSFANSTITVSFWAKASSGTPKIALEFQQGFGSGGSPSADVNTYGGQATLSTSWARYSLTGTVPNINGKTIGTTFNTSFLGIHLWLSGGSTFNSRTGSLGIQNNTFDIWGVQVERGSVATPFEQRPISYEFAMCQRYYEKSYNIDVAPGSSNAAGPVIAWQERNIIDGAGFYNYYGTIPFRVTKRVAPTLSFWSQAGTSDRATVNRAGNTGTTGFYNRYVATSADTSSSSQVHDIGQSGAVIRWTNDSTLRVLDMALFHYVAEAEF